MVCAHGDNIFAINTSNENGKTIPLNSGKVLGKLPPLLFTIILNKQHAAL